MAAATDTFVAIRAAPAPRPNFERLLLYVLAGLLVVLLTWPFFWAVSSSLKDVSEVTAEALVRRKQRSFATAR
jgi:ABC-type glycerol-3-phosphate transport system permease component